MKSRWIICKLILLILKHIYIFFYFTSIILLLLYKNRDKFYIFFHLILSNIINNCLHFTFIFLKIKLYRNNKRKIHRHKHTKHTLANNNQTRSRYLSFIFFVLFSTNKLIRLLSFNTNYNIIFYFSHKRDFDISN